MTGGCNTQPTNQTAFLKAIHLKRYYDLANFHHTRKYTPQPKQPTQFTHTLSIYLHLNCVADEQQRGWDKDRNKACTYLLDIYINVIAVDKTAPSAYG